MAVVRSYEDRLSKVEERLDKVEERLAELAEIVRSHEERLARLEEAVSQLTRAVGELAKAVAALDRRVLALGARRGVESEEAFRRAMRGVVKEILGVAKAEGWSYFDAGGLVFGYPSQVEVDVAVRDGVHILVEIKASASSGDVLKLLRIGRLYEEAVGARPRLAIVASYIDEEGLEVARRLGVEVYTA